MTITTTILNKHSPIVYHRLSGSITEDEASEGAAKALEIIACTTRVDLIIDVRGYAFDNLKAHKIWSLEFKEHSLVIDKVVRVAVVGDDSPRMRAEQQMMESDTLRFFVEPLDAENWLISTDTPSSRPQSSSRTIGTFTDY